MDTVTLVIPPEPQAQMRLGLAGSAIMRGSCGSLVMWDSAQLSPPVLTLSDRLHTIVIVSTRYVRNCTCYRRFWNPKNQIILSRSKRCSRTLTSYGGLTRGRRSD